MHRTHNLFLLSLTALALAACGSDENSSSESSDPSSDTAASVAESVDTAVNEVEATAEDMMSEAQDATASAADDMAGVVDDAGQAAQEAADEVMAAAGMASAASDDDPCTLAIEVGDNIAYSTDALSVPSSCSDVSVTITHTGTLPAVAMGHNWVLLPEDALQSIASAGVSAGLEGNYVPDDGRIVAATRIVGGGESDTVTFSLGALQDGVTYKYVCTFPGHWAVMQGSFTVSG